MRETNEYKLLTLLWWRGDVFDSSLIPVPRLLCGAGSVIVDILSCQDVDWIHFEAHSLMYNDKSSDYSEQPPQDYHVSDKAVINMNCKDPSL